MPCTRDSLLAAERSTLVDFLYLRTAGDPEGGVRKGLHALQDKYGSFPVRGVGITGSGRERLGPAADTVFEIGGQDSKYISLQGGVDYNPGIAAAFQSACSRVHVSPVFSISGAFGAALLAQESVGGGASTFLGVDFPAQEKRVQATSEEIRRNRAFYRKAGQLAEQDVDYIFLPYIHTIRHPHAHAAHNYACPYMQKAAEIVSRNLHLADRGIQLLTPVFDLDLGAKMMAKSLLGVGAQLGFPKPRCLPGLCHSTSARTIRTCTGPSATTCSPAQSSSPTTRTSTPST